METRLYSKYHELDDEIVKKASENGFYLTGGTALEVWQTLENFDKTRKRSDNDLDFFYLLDNQKGYDKFEEFLTEKGFRAKYMGKVSFYYLYSSPSNVMVEAELLVLNPKYKKYLLEVRGIKLCSPVLLYLSKFKRYSSPSTTKQRKDKDKKDLLSIRRLIKHMNLDEVLIKECLLENIRLEELI